MQKVKLWERCVGCPSRARSSGPAASCHMIDSEISVLQVEKRIRTRVKLQIDKTQREYFLNEQMKAERLIGSIRRECVDNLIVFREAQLRRILNNELRTNRSLNKDAPFHRAIQRLGAITSLPVLGGLHHQYCRI